MSDIPVYQAILIVVIIAALLELILQNTFKLRSKLQDLIKSKLLYLAFSIVLISVLSIPIEINFANSRWYPYFRCVILGILVFMCNISYYKKENTN